jgi:hypothetical protein
MLRNFFKLNEPFQKYDEAQLIGHFRTSNDLQNVLYDPPNWPRDFRGRNNATFKNVSLSKTLIHEVTFKDCTFEDCLFIGTTFDSVEFHNCEFKNCNFYKTDLVDCYFDPKSVKFDRSYRKTAANVGVQLFQKILENSSRARQPFFEMDADIRFRQWKRWQLNYDYAQQKISWFKLKHNWLRSALYELTCGFGYRPARFALATILFFLFVASVNWWMFRDGLNVNGLLRQSPDFVDSVYFTFSILTVLGFSSIVPMTGFAKVLTVLEALVGVGWMGVFTSLLVKRFLK